MFGLGLPDSKDYDEATPRGIQAGKLYLERETSVLRFLRSRHT